MAAKQKTRSLLTIALCCLIASMSFSHCGQGLSPAGGTEEPGGEGEESPPSAPSGSLDTTFGTGGIVIHDFSSLGDAFRAVVLQADGKIVAAGHLRPSGVPDLLVARFTEAGVLDSSFASVGWATFPLTGQDEQANAVALQSNGKILVAGTNANSGGTRGLVARFTHEGLIDSSFSADGIVFLNTVGNDASNGMVVKESGGIAEYFVVGTCSGEAVSEDITLDQLDEGGGSITRRLQDLGSGGADGGLSIMLGPPGRLIVGGRGVVSGANQEFVVAQFTADSNLALDTSFGAGGFVTSGQTFADEARALVQVDGFIYFGGTLGGESTSQHAMGRITALETFDTLFGESGFAKLSSSEIGGANALAVDTAGRVYSAGTSATTAGSDVVVARYLSSGALDPSFNATGIVSIAVTPSGTNVANGIVIDQNGKIVVVGSTTSASGPDSFLLRLNP